MVWISLPDFMIGGGDGVGQVVRHRTRGDYLPDVAADIDQVFIAGNVQRTDALGDAPLQIVGLHEPAVGPDGNRKAIRHRQPKFDFHFAELGVFAADTAGPLAAQGIKRQCILLRLDRATGGQNQVDLALDVVIRVAEGGVLLAAERNHLLDHVTHDGLDRGKIGAYVVDVKEVFALRLFFHVADDLEHTVIPVQNRQEMGETLAYLRQYLSGILTLAPEESGQPSHYQRPPA